MTPGRGRSDGVGAPLLGAVARHVAPSLGLAVTPAGPPPGGLVDAALGHGVLGLLSGEHVAGAVADHCRQQRARLVRAHADAATAAAAAAAVGAPLLMVKGPALAHSVYPRPDTRPFSDVDLLTSPEAFGALLSALEEAGGRVLVRNWTLMSARRRSELSVAMPAGTVLDLHWDLANDPAVRARTHLGAADLATGATEGPVSGIAVPRTPEHLVYVAWHAVRSGSSRLVWACDVELLARSFLPRPAAELHGVADRAGVALALAVALDTSALTFPGGASEALASGLPRSVWRQVNARHRSRVLRRPVDGRTGAFLPRATRRTTWGSAMALRPPPLRRRPPPEVDPLDLDRGGLAGRSSYVESVARRSW